MPKKSLSEDLLRIPGVEGAEVDGSQDAPAGLRIRIAEGADQQAVGGAIRRVLDSHGLGTDTRLPGEPEAAEGEAGGVAVLTSLAEDVEADEAEPQPPIDEGRAVIDLTDEPAEERPAVDPEPGVPDQPAVPDTDQQVSQTRGSWRQGDLPSFVEPRTQPAPPPPEDAALPIARIDHVSVEEGRSGVRVAIVASDGTQVSQVASSTEGGVDSAVVKAAAKLVDDTAPDPTVVDIVDRRVDGVDIVMIVLKIDGVLKAGSAVVGAGRVFALGRATWAALAL